MMKPRQATKSHTQPPRGPPSPSASSPSCSIARCDRELRSNMEAGWAMQPQGGEYSFPGWLNPPGVAGLDVNRPSVLVHQFQTMSMMLLWMLATCARIILALLPTLVPLPVLTDFLKRLSAAWDDYSSVTRIGRKTGGASDAGGLHGVAVSESAIERALTQVLALVNDVPASSNKYAFVQDLADRLIEENRVEGGKYKSINRAALRRGFARTINLLGQSLESRGQNHSFLGRLVSHFPSGAMFPSVTILGPFSKIRSLVGHILSPLSVWSPSSGPSRNEAAHLANLADTDMAEKFAKELLWIAEKLLACGGMEEAVQQWSSASSLAELSLCASPKVQKSLVRLSALLCKGLVGNTDTPHEVCLKLILVWIPLLCNATHGGDGPIFNSLEKGDAERQLERLVAGLPETDQEQILSTWLQQYAMSQSDWPNLQNCYNTWCYTTRKLEIDMSKVMRLEY